MRPWSLVFLLLAAAPASGSGGVHAVPGDGAATAALQVEERVLAEHSSHGGGRHNMTEAERAAFYLKVGRFAVMVHSFWHGIKPVPKVERVESVSTRDAEDGGTDYLLVLRVGPPLGKCRALVWGVGSENWKLKSFEQVARA
ncbi:hypothetical protein HU200_023708 [Digitaria exilis]|uniref:Cystatin domain-containing protein n=1 Tax=Digitaria exilis TaxID=1010633 RepID=A0A835CBE1_9POAL|nr:hypothetical protein HU200_023708 [Digitaria exilis]